MALSLSAEQKSLMRVFFNEDRFIIPDYQRPYSWGSDECTQLYMDITSAFLEDASDYFIGSIIMARATEAGETDANIVDGQQRLITIWIFLKCMSLLMPDIKKIQKALSTEPWNEDCPVPKIHSLVEDNEEGFDIEYLWKLDKQQTQKLIAQIQNGCNDPDMIISENKFTTNYAKIYCMMKDFIESLSESDITRFWNFFINKVYLLPIELQGKTMVEAEDKAMIIFETINNRGLDLRDADIFKSRLYKKAKKAGKQSVFVEQWQELTSQCKELNITVDDVFRHYMHITRGQNRVTDKEKSLRDFFMNDELSPIRKCSFEVVNDDLQKIITAIQYKQSQLLECTEVGKWLQILEEYSNVYPQYAIVAYLFKYGTDDESKFIEYLQKIIRYCYYSGATVTVKFEIYNIIRNVSLDIEVDSYRQAYIDYDSFPYLGRLKNGFALLAYYLNEGRPLALYSVDRLIKESDEKTLIGWGTDRIETARNSIANYVVLDSSPRRVPLARKYYYYKNSKIPEVRSLLSKESVLNIETFNQREGKLKSIIFDFFSSTPSIF